MGCLDNAVEVKGFLLIVRRDRGQGPGNFPGVPGASSSSGASPAHPPVGPRKFQKVQERHGTTADPQKPINLWMSMGSLTIELSFSISLALQSHQSQSPGHPGKETWITGGGGLRGGLRVRVRWGQMERSEGQRG